MIEKTKSIFFPSDAEKSTPSFSFKKITWVSLIPSILVWGIAIPLPTLVLPSRSLSFSFSIISDDKVLFFLKKYSQES